MAQPAEPQGAAGIIRMVMEAIVLVSVAWSPWALGAVEPPSEMLLYATVAVLLVLWGLRAICAGTFVWHKCPVFLCLGGLFFLGVLQEARLSAETLSWLSPATARLYAELLPASAERIAGNDITDLLTPGAGSLSLYPGATKRVTLRLLVVLCLFACVRNNLATVATLRRLAVVVLVNGALLSILALAQMLSSSPHMVYWSWSVPGAGVFGPFICRNHFPFYVNIALGLGIGLLLALRTHSGPAPGQRSTWREVVDGLIDFIQQPLALWLVLGLVLCLSGVVLSQSRGGFLVLLATTLLWLAARIVIVRGATALTAQTWVVAVALSLGLAVVLGLAYDRASTRLSRMWGGEGLEDARWAVWWRGLSLVPDFPVFGSGYGTFQHVEGLRRSDGEEQHLYYDAAHNEYLEALVEGGVLRLGLSLLAIYLLGRYGWRALQHYRRSPGEGLIWGALFGLTTVVLHSFGDFGLHVPAVVWLVTVLAALVVGLGAGETTGAASGSGESAGAWQGRGFVPYVACAVFVALALVLCGNGWSRYVTHRLSEAARALQDRADPQSLMLRASYLDQAVVLLPRNVALQLRRGRVYAQMYDEEVKEVRRLDKACTTAQLVFDSAFNPGLGSFAALYVANRIRNSFAESDERLSAAQHLGLALHAYIEARNACPLHEEPHRALALFSDSLLNGDKTAVYLRRAKLLSPGIPLVWYECGLQELDSDPDEALKSWRRCLELDPPMNKYISKVLDKCKSRFPPERIAAEVLGDNPAQLLLAAQVLYPEDAGEPSEGKKALALRALRALDSQAEPDHETFYLKGKANRALDRVDESIVEYRKAVDLNPHVVYRLELAEQLRARGRLPEALRELNDIMAHGTRSGAYYEAQALKALVVQEIALTVGAKN